ncbi:MAG: oxidoreductase [Marmoricola sp.]|nr:oxidoreductase [Marmoricola sp.]
MEPTTTDTRPLALVTGASGGIGLELALELARRGHDLVMVADDAELGGAAARVRELGAHVDTVRCDLRRAAAVEEVDVAVTRVGRPLAVAALNAGHGHGGSFVENDLADELSIIDLNVVSTVRLAKWVLRDMVAAGAGRVLVTSSVAAEMPGPYQAIYNASKAFLQSFGQGLQDELRETGVTLTLLLPGPTDTPFFARAGMLDTAMGQGPKDPASTVARQGVEALLAGQARVTGGRAATRAQELVLRFVPDRVTSLLHRGVARPGSGR